MMKKTIAFCCLAMLWMSCTRDGGRSNLLGEIEKIEKAKETGTPENRQKLMDLYESFLEKFPLDSLSGRFLADVTTYHRAKGHFDQSIELGRKYLSQSFQEQEIREIYLAMAQSFARINRADSSITYFEWAQDLQPLENAYLIELGEQYSMRTANLNGRHKEDLLIKAANIKMVTGSKSEAFVLYQQFIDSFENSEFSPYAMMRQTEILEEDGKIEEGNKLLRKLISTYPNSNFAKDAAIMLEKKLLGKTDDEKFAIITAGK